MRASGSRADISASCHVGWESRPLPLGITCVLQSEVLNPGPRGVVCHESQLVWPTGSPCKGASLHARLRSKSGSLWCNSWTHAALGLSSSSRDKWSITFRSSICSPKCQNQVQSLRDCFGHCPFVCGHSRLMLLEARVATSGVLPACLSLHARQRASSVAKSL